MLKQRPRAYAALEQAFAPVILRTSGDRSQSESSAGFPYLECLAAETGNAVKPAIESSCAFGYGRRG